MEKIRNANNHTWFVGEEESTKELAMVKKIGRSWTCQSVEHLMIRKLKIDGTEGICEENKIPNNSLQKTSLTNYVLY